MTTHRWASLLLLAGLLFGEGYAVAPVRTTGGAGVIVTIVCADTAVEVAELGEPAAATPPAPSAAPWRADPPRPERTPVHALYQRPPPAFA